MIPKVLNAIDMVFTGCKQSRMIDAFMIKGTHIQDIVASITIGINDAVRSDLARNDGISVDALVSETTLVYTLPPHFKIQTQLFYPPPHDPACLSLRVPPK